MAKKYIQIKLSEDLTQLIDQLIDEKYLAYRNRADFCVDAIRRRLEEIEKLRGKQHEKKE